MIITKGKYRLKYEWLDGGYGLPQWTAQVRRDEGNRKYTVFPFTLPLRVTDYSPDSLIVDKDRDRMTKEELGLFLDECMETIEGKTR